MRRRIAVVGDALTSGGRILDYTQESGFHFHGHKAALLGNQAFCDMCKSTGILAKAGGPRRLRFHTTREVALDGDVLLCKCPTPPRVVAALAQESWCEDGAAEHGAGPLLGQTASDAIAVNRYDEQFVLRGRDGHALANVRYRIDSDDGRVFMGVTDASGKTQRVSTGSASRLRLHVAG